MARKSMNLLDILVWLKTTGDQLNNGLISNIYYEKEYERLILKVKSNLVKDLLVIEAGKRIHLSSRVVTPSDYKPYPLVVLARKYLRGDRIQDISLQGNDRIVKITGRRGYSIIAELIPRGVIVLLDDKDSIIALTRTLRLRDRVLKPKINYIPPPAQESIIIKLVESKIENFFENLVDCIRSGKDAVRGLIRGCRIPGELAEEALYRAGIDKQREVGDLRENDLQAIIEALTEIVEESFAGKGWLIIQEYPIEADPFKPLRHIERGDLTVQEYSPFDEALDILFAQPVREPRARTQDDTTGDSEYYRLLKSIEEAEKRAREYVFEAEKKKKIAELVAKHYQDFDKLFDIITRNKAEKVTLGKVIVTRLNDRYVIELPNDIKFDYYHGETVDSVILRLYREAGELEAKATRAEQVKEEILKRIDELKIKVKARELSQRVRRRKRFWFEKYHWTVTRNNLLAIGGRDASQNEAVVKKHLSQNDLFLHANIHGAPAVVLKIKDKTPQPEDIFDAAVITAAYSRAWKAGAGSIDVYWVTASQVSFSPPTGEYLAKGGIMVYGKKNYLPKPVPIKISIGIAINEEGVPIVMTGSEEAIHEKTLVYSVLVPGDHSKSETARILKNKWYETLNREYKHIPYAVPDEEIMPRIPGRSRIIRTKSGYNKGIVLRDLEN
ncbi:MAG: NFACT family protein [Desulfurococcales archaeon]|nr:NFACT family protein [Desulfurococcales archaeon]